MSLIENVIRADVRAMTGYHVPDASGFVKLDAMENPYRLPEELCTELGRRLAQAELNRYPVASYSTLKAKICATLGVPAGLGVILGNGSDELISIVSVACAKPGAKVLVPLPAFVMYSVYARLAGLEFVGVPLRSDFTLDRDAMIAAIREHKPAITYLAYPNNPTGNLYDADVMEEIIEAVGDRGIVVVDEAYQPFAQASFMSRLTQFNNLVVMRTVSKLGLAGIRLGYMAADAALLAEFDKVRPPYNVNILTQVAAEFMMEHVEVLDNQAALLRSEREKLSAALAALPCVEVFPSSANFLLIRIQGQGVNADTVFSRLLERKILIKNAGKMHALLQNCLRVNVSTPQENTLFLEALRASLSSPT
ncbi:MAG: histidinol-phosphate transaminase [Burkholderiales bacterium]|nr:histidinol-phosphate transaminase [Burkholderiales bacterium]